MLKSLVIAALTLGAAPVAAGQAYDPPRTAVVRIADLDPGTDAGAAALDRRFAGAVRHVCPKPESRDLHGWRRHDACLATAERSVAEQRDRLASHPRSGVVRVAVAR